MQHRCIADVWRVGKRYCGRRRFCSLSRLVGLLCRPKSVRMVLSYVGVFCSDCYKYTYYKNAFLNTIDLPHTYTHTQIFHDLFQQRGEQFLRQLPAECSLALCESARQRIPGGCALYVWHGCQCPPSMQSKPAHLAKKIPWHISTHVLFDQRRLWRACHSLNHHLSPSWPISIPYCHDYHPTQHLYYITMLSSTTITLGHSSAHIAQGIYAAANFAQQAGDVRYDCKPYLIRWYCLVSISYSMYIPRRTIRSEPCVSNPIYSTWT